VRTPLTLLTLAFTVGMMGCESHDPSKWYFTGYENSRYIFQHDHEVYTAECIQSFGVGAGQNQQDATPDCTDIIELVGIGHEVPEMTAGNVSWLAIANMAIYTPTGDLGPQLQFNFTSIKGEK
jgi:hypothetical protein